MSCELLSLTLWLVGTEPIPSPVWYWGLFFLIFSSGSFSGIWWVPHINALICDQWKTWGGDRVQIARVLSVHFSPVLAVYELYPPWLPQTPSSVFSGILWVIPRFPLPEMCLGSSPDSKLEYQAFTLFVSHFLGIIVLHYLTSKYLENCFMYFSQFISYSKLCGKFTAWFPSWPEAYVSAIPLKLFSPYF